MDEARHVPSETRYTAVEFSKLSPAQLATFRGELVCEECRQPAYYVSKSVSGKPSFFGARPHAPGCELATTKGEKNAASLSTVNAREAREGVLRLQGQRDAIDMRHVEHEPGDDLHLGKARRYVSDADERGLATPTIAMNRLLSRLVNEPEYREDRGTRLIMPNGGETTVRAFCVEMHDVSFDKHADQRYLYWGTIIYGQKRTWIDEQSGEAGAGVWLYTARGLPNLLLDQDLYDHVVRRKKIDDIGDLAGATFLYLGYLNVPRSNADGAHAKRLFMHPKDPLWFVVRLASQDADR